MSLNITSTEFSKETSSASSEERRRQEKMEIDGTKILIGDNYDVIEDNKELISNVKLFYLDPPYNNKELYNHYDDRFQSDAWLENLTKLIEVCRKRLSNDGSIWISIDDNEMHYLKVALDRIFGKQNFVSTIVWNHRKTRENRSIFSTNHEYILVYAKDIKSFKSARNRLPISLEIVSRYKNQDNDPRGPWQSVSINVQDGHATKSQFYEIIGPNRKRHLPPNGRCWAYSQERFEELLKDNRIWFGKNNNGVPREKKFLSERRSGVTPHTLWLASEVGDTDSAKKYLLKMLPNGLVFDTPKPQKLIERIIEIATNVDDLVVDPFLGSGTTLAAAKLLGRRSIGIDKSEKVAAIARKRIEFSDIVKD